MKTDTKPNWLNKISSEEKTEIEPFSKRSYEPELTNFNGYIVVAVNPRGTKKINFALRIEDDINNNLNDCSGSKNAVINALLRYAIADLQAKNKTLTA